MNDKYCHLDRSQSTDRRSGEIYSCCWTV